MGGEARTFGYWVADEGAGMVNPTGSVSAVPTHYSGVLFRSKLEADWAATFVHLGWVARAYP